ncbi:MAG: metallophosphoesterase [Chryseotalea sp.]
MKARMITFAILAMLLLAMDFYLFQAVLNLTKSLAPFWKNFWRYAFWFPTIISFSFLLWWNFGDPYKFGPAFRTWLFAGVAGIYISKFFGLIFLLIDDLQRAVRWVFQSITKKETLPGDSITRSEFLSKAALVATAVPFGVMTFGILTGAHDYRIRRKKVAIQNLPKAFHGLRVVQLSDIHSGSFFNKTAVKGGVEMALSEKPDVIFFTGDLVNNKASEVEDYISIFDKLKAPLGVYSVTGNHDYGDYVAWTSQEQKQKNFKNLMEAHRLLGFNLLMNENKLITLNGDQLAIVGIENWGAGRFAKYGKLDVAYAGTQDAATKILLSHDPSHWDAQVKNYKDIDLMLAGHTHGFQFGVEIGDFKWSPSQYAYKQWAGMYQDENQFLYVNRGFGYIGYPGRIGMPPEITVLELVQA